MSGEAQISVKWSGYGGNLVGAVAAAAVAGAEADVALADVTLVADGRSFPAHRLVLSASSELFRALFRQTPAPVRANDTVVVLHEVEAECVRALLCFMYRGEVRVSEQLLPRLLQAADALRVRGLSASAPPAPLPNLDREKIPSLPKKRKKSYSDASKCNKKFKETSETCDHHIVAVVPKEEPAERMLRAAPPPPPPPRSVESVESEEYALQSGAAVELLAPASSSASTDTSTVQDSCGTSYASPSFPCPFCPRVYNSWGYRRRHVKSRHRTDRLSCKWCVSVLESTGAWYGHATSAHGAPAAAARDSLVVLVEAHAVLTLHEPSPAALLRQLHSGDTQLD